MDGLCYKCGTKDVEDWERLGWPGEPQIKPCSECGESTGVWVHGGRWRKRLETGAYQRDLVDWPGVFIRGDDSFAYAMALKNIRDGRVSPFDSATLDCLIELLESCEVGRKKKNEEGDSGSGGDASRSGSSGPDGIDAVGDSGAPGSANRV